MKSAPYFLTRSVTLRWLLVFGAILTSGDVARAQTPGSQVPGSQVPSEDEQAIRATSQSYVVAFNKHDAQTLAALYSPDSVYTNRSTGHQVTGREAIQKEFEGLFQKNRETKLSVSIESVQFISPNVAVEHGSARFVTTSDEPINVDYSAVYVKRDGKWLMDRVTDTEIPVVRSNYEQLKVLEWLIGKWVDQDDEARIVTECKWTKNKNFIVRSFTVTVAEYVDLSGMQVIGWDPSAKQIRSWVFDSDGGFAQAVWAEKNGQWHIHKTGVLPDGRITSAVTIIRKIDDNTLGLQSVSRSAGREMLPNIDEVRVIRE